MREPLPPSGKWEKLKNALAKDAFFLKYEKFVRLEGTRGGLRSHERFRSFRAIRVGVLVQAD